MFQTVFVWVAPRQGCAVRYIDEAHGAAWMQLTGRAYRLGLAIRESKRLSMTSGTRLSSIPSHALVVEQ